MPVFGAFGGLNLFAKKAVLPEKKQAGILNIPAC
jgi:hypothetical protein